MDIAQRLRALIETMGLSNKDFSDRVGLPYRTVQNYIYGSRSPNAESLIQICTRTGVDANWLLLGMGAPVWREESGAAMEAMVVAGSADEPSQVEEAADAIGRAYHEAQTNLRQIVLPACRESAGQLVVATVQVGRGRGRALGKELITLVHERCSAVAQEPGAEDEVVLVMGVALLEHAVVDSSVDSDLQPGRETG